MSNHDERDDLLETLIDHMAQRANGILFVATGNNQAISLGLTDGRITYCTGARAHGQESVVRLSQASVAHYSFTEGGNFPFRSVDEIVHEEAVNVLIPGIAGSVTVEVADDARESARVRQRMYRGRPVSMPERQSASADHPPRRTRSTSIRYYRGQPIRDGA